MDFPESVLAGRKRSHVHALHARNKTYRAPDQRSVRVSVQRARLGALNKIWDPDYREDFDDNQRQPKNLDSVIDNITKKHFREREPIEQKMTNKDSECVKNIHHKKAIIKKYSVTAETDATSASDPSDTKASSGSSMISGRCSASLRKRTDAVSPLGKLRISLDETSSSNGLSMQSSISTSPISNETDPWPYEASTSNASSHDDMQNTKQQVGKHNLPTTYIRQQHCRKAVPLKYVRDNKTNEGNNNATPSPSTEYPNIVSAVQPETNNSKTIYYPHVPDTRRYAFGDPALTNRTNEEAHLINRIPTVLNQQPANARDPRLTNEIAFPPITTSAQPTNYGIEANPPRATVVAKPARRGRPPKNKTANAAAIYHQVVSPWHWDHQIGFQRARPSSGRPPSYDEYLQIREEFAKRDHNTHMSQMQSVPPSFINPNSQIAAAPLVLNYNSTEPPQRTIPTPSLELPRPNWATSMERSSEPLSSFANLKIPQTPDAPPQTPVSDLLKNDVSASLPQNEPAAPSQNGNICQSPQSQSVPTVSQSNAASTSTSTSSSFGILPVDVPQSTSPPKTPILTSHPEMNTPPKEPTQPDDVATVSTTSVIQSNPVVTTEPELPRTSTPTTIQHDDVTPSTSQPLDCANDSISSNQSAKDETTSTIEASNGVNGRVPALNDILSQTNVEKLQTSLYYAVKSLTEPEPTPTPTPDPKDTELDDDRAKKTFLAINLPNEYIQMLKRSGNVIGNKKFIAKLQSLVAKQIKESKEEGDVVLMVPDENTSNDETCRMREDKSPDAVVVISSDSDQSDNDCFPVDIEEPNPNRRLEQNDPAAHHQTDSRKRVSEVKSNEHRAKKNRREFTFTVRRRNQRELNRDDQSKANGPKSPQCVTSTTEENNRFETDSENAPYETEVDYDHCYLTTPQPETFYDNYDENYDENYEENYEESYEENYEENYDENYDEYDENMPNRNNHGSCKYYPRAKREETNTTNEFNDGNEMDYMTYEDEHLQELNEYHDEDHSFDDNYYADDENIPNQRNSPRKYEEDYPYVCEEDTLNRWETRRRLYGRGCWRHKDQILKKRGESFQPNYDDVNSFNENAYDEDITDEIVPDVPRQSDEYERSYRDELDPYENDVPWRPHGNQETLRTKNNWFGGDHDNYEESVPNQSRANDQLVREDVKSNQSQIKIPETQVILPKTAVIHEIKKAGGKIYKDVSEMANEKEPEKKNSFKMALINSFERTKELGNRLKQTGNPKAEEASSSGIDRATTVKEDVDRPKERTSEETKTYSATIPITINGLPQQNISKISLERVNVEFDKKRPASNVDEAPPTPPPPPPPPPPPKRSISINLNEDDDEDEPTFLMEQMLALSSETKLSPTMYVEEMNALSLDTAIPEDFKEFYRYVVKRQILGEKTPVNFRTFMELLNAGCLTEYHNKYERYKFWRTIDDVGEPKCTSTSTNTVR